MKNINFIKNIKSEILIVCTIYIIVGIIGTISAYKEYNIQDNNFKAIAPYTGINSNPNFRLSEALEVSGNNLSVAIDSIYWGLTSLTYYSFEDLITFQYESSKFIASVGLEENVNPLLVWFLGVFPHGIFEIPAILLSVIIPIYIWKKIIMYLYFALKTYVNKKELLKPKIQIQKIFTGTLMTATSLMVLLFIIAGFAESFITTITLSYLY